MQKYLKINGFHTSGSGGRPDGIGDFLRGADAAGVPFLAYCVDGTVSLVDAQNIMRQSNVPHNAIFRRSTFPHNQGGKDTPDYNIDPQKAAILQWRSHVERWPQELDKSLIWGETVNELRKEVESADWIGRFCYYTAVQALQDGMKWCGPGYSFGTPDHGAWATDGMLMFLELAADHPDQIAVALHEYSGTTDSIWFLKGNHVGRFLGLVNTCIVNGIEPPTIFFTEWGWAERNVPNIEQAMREIREVGDLYADYPNVKGAAIWALDGGQWKGLAEDTNKLMKPLLKEMIDFRNSEPKPEPSEKVSYKRFVHLLPQNVTDGEVQEVLKEAKKSGPLQTITSSADDAGDLVGRGAEGSKVYSWGIDRWLGDIAAWLNVNYGADCQVMPFANEQNNGILDGLALGYLFKVPYTLTSPFNSERNYSAFGGKVNDKHEGTDYDVITASADSQESVLCVHGGMVSRVHTSAGYGKSVTVEHAFNGEYFLTQYCHLDEQFVTVGQILKEGDPVGEIGATGNSNGEHVHFNLIVPGRGLSGYVVEDVVDPEPYFKNHPHKQWETIYPPVEQEREFALRVGLHAGADGGDITDGELLEFYDLQPDVIKILSSSSAFTVSRLSYEHPGATFIIRAFLDFGGRKITPTQFYLWTISDVMRAVDILYDKHPICIELHNEPNLASEGLGTSWKDGKEFNDWLLDVMYFYDRHIPDGVQLIFPGLSPGGAVGDIKHDSVGFLRACQSSLADCDALGIHAYFAPQAGWPIRKTIEQMATAIGDYRRDVWITEASNNRGGIIPQEKAEQYVQFMKEVNQNFSKVAGVTFFVASASNPSWHWPDGTCETWIPARMGRRVRGLL